MPGFWFNFNLTKILADDASGNSQNTLFLNILQQKNLQRSTFFIIFWSVAKFLCCNSFWVAIFSVLQILGTFPSGVQGSAVRGARMSRNARKHKVLQWFWWSRQYLEGCDQVQIFVFRSSLRRLLQSFCVAIIFGLQYFVVATFPVAIVFGCKIFRKRVVCSPVLLHRPNQ